MVSIRRRKLLGLCSGRSSFLTPLPKFFNDGHTPENRLQNSKPVSVYPMPSIDEDQPKEETTQNAGPGSSNLSTSNSSKEQKPQQFPEVKRRKRHRRKHSEHHEPCLMRGVYFKNMKWQAAIKVDKKQIHLGTVGSQEEAARLYDRAAFMCGREPNFDLSEEEKQELRKLEWEEFLAITRSAITNKKPRKNNALSSRKKSEPPMQINEWEGENGGSSFSASDEVEPETLES